MSGPEQITLRRPSPEEAPSSPPALFSSPKKVWALLLLLFFAVYFVALFSPSLLDDVDASHAMAAQHMLSSGDWVTMYIDGVRYLQKAPLPYWMVAVDFVAFGENVFAAHLPMSLAVLGCSVLAWFWARRAWGDRAAFYSALAMMTCVGAFLFTRFFIPDSLFTFFELLALYCFLTGLEDRKPLRLYIAYASVALALLSNGLAAPVFFVGPLIPYLIITGEWRRWREFRLFTGILVFLAVGAPWHILASLATPDEGHPVGNVPHPGHVHGFFYFYFINEQFLRFLGQRYPDDYNKQPWFVYWFGQLIWIFPWSLFVPLALRRAWRNRRIFLSDLRYDSTNTIEFLDPKLSASESSTMAARLRFRARTSLMLALYAGFILLFFSFSTNQEYYTWPIYPAVLMLICGSLAVVEESPDPGGSSSRWLNGVQLAFVSLGLLVAALLAYGLWASRHLPYISDIGTLMAHRDVGDYTLSLSHFFDITGKAFAALRAPALTAAIAFLIGPLLAWRLRRRGNSLESTVTVGLTMAAMLVAAHMAYARFEPMLSSKPFATTINRIMAEPGNANSQIMIYGDESDGSSIIFYTHHPALLVHGKTWYFQPGREDDGELFGSSMIWGSCYIGAPHIFLSDQDLLRLWGKGPRHLLFVPRKYHQHVKNLLGNRLYKIQELSDKTLYTDRPL